MDSKLAVGQESDIKAKHCVPVFCVFELYQFERDRIKILKFHLKSLTPLMGMIWKLAAVVTKASPDQWAIVIGGP